MKTLVISCSHRKHSNSRRVADVALEITRALDKSTCTLFDLGEQPIPLWEEAIWNGDEDWKKKLGPLQTEANNCDSLILIVPEYAGMAAPAAKNVMLMLNGNMVAHKPALLVSVSASIGGTYPVAEMRLSATKNNRILWIPDHVIVRSAGDFKPPFSDHQASTYKRLSYGIEVLNLYANAMTPMRQNPLIEKLPFDFGM